jgi:ADP-ribose pyrophosphatase
LVSKSLGIRAAKYGRIATMKKRKEEILFRGEWLSIKRASYRSLAGAAINWEVVERSRAETVIILLARLMSSGRVLLLRQFRAGINRTVIALPAGVVLPGIDPRLQAAAELKEETGYTGSIVDESPPLKINPAILDCDVIVYRMEIDEAAPENRDPRQALEPEEEIEVVPVRPEEIREFLLAEKKKGREVDVACWLAFAPGA